MAAIGAELPELQAPRSGECCPIPDPFTRSLKVAPTALGSKSNLQRDLHQLWHTVLLGAGDDLVRDGERQLAAGIDVTAVVDARPDPRLGRFVAKCG
jgi:hypothetical protein